MSVQDTLITDTKGLAGVDGRLPYVAFGTCFAIAVTLSLLLTPIAGLAVWVVFILVLMQRWLLSWSSVFAALVLSVLLIPSNLYALPSSLPFDLEPYRAAVLFAGTIWLAAMVAGREIRLQRTPIDGALLLLVGAVLASFVVNAISLDPVGEFRRSLFTGMYFLTFPLVFYMFASTAVTAHRAHRLLALAIGTCAVLGVLASLERATGFNPFHTLHTVVPFLESATYGLNPGLVRGGLRVSGSAAHPISFGALLGLVLPVALAWWASARNRLERWLLGSAACLIGAGMLLTVSRSALIALAIAGVMTVVLFPGKRLQLIIGLGASAFAVHMVFPGTLAMLKRTMMPSYILATEVGNPSGRLEDYPRVWALFVEAPLFGRGIGTFDPNTFFFVDNQYLKTLVETGLLGLATLVGLFWCSHRALRKAAAIHDGLTAALLTGLSVSVIVFAVLTTLFDILGFPQVAVLLFILLGLGVSLSQEDGSWTEDPTAEGSHEHI